MSDESSAKPGEGGRGVTESLRKAGLLYAGGIGLAILVAVVIFLIARTIDPAPPRSVRLATGAPGGAYAAAGARLAERLAVDGVTLELVSTSGSVENIARLEADDDGVDAAIVQGGVGVEVAQAGHLQSLGGLFYEPLWLFTRSGLLFSDLRDLRGLRVAVGPEGSGVRALAMLLLEENGLAGDALTLSPLAGQAAADALKAGEIDAAVLVTSQETAYVKALVLDPGVTLASFTRAEAYARRHRYLSDVTLPHGVIDLARDVPAADVRLIAPAAALVVKEELHPAIQSLLLQAASEIYRTGDVMAPPGTFPSRDLVSFPLSEEAQRFYERGGPSLLRSWLPFWAANLVDRLWVLAIPAATLLYPLLKSAPPIYKWQVERRIHVWYRDLRRLESEGRRATDAAIKARVRSELRQMLAEVGDLKVPLPYNDDVYRLRAHIRLADQIISEADAGADIAGAA